MNQDILLQIKKDIVDEKLSLTNAQKISYTKELPYTYPLIKVKYLLTLDGKNFVENAVSSICGVKGLCDKEKYLELFEKGKIDKEELLLRLRLTPEGMAMKSVLSGMKFDIRIVCLNTFIKIRVIAVRIYNAFKSLVT